MEGEKNLSLEGGQRATKPKRRRRKNIGAEQVQQRLLEIADRCMEAEPKRVYNKSTKQWEEVGSWEFDAANAIRALTEIGKYLGVNEKGEEGARREIIIDFGGHEDYDCIFLDEATQLTEYQSSKTLKVGWDTVGSPSSLPTNWQDWMSFSAQGTEVTKTDLSFVLEQAFQVGTTYFIWLSTQSNSNTHTIKHSNSITLQGLTAGR